MPSFKAVVPIGSPSVDKHLPFFPPKEIRNSAFAAPDPNAELGFRHIPSPTDNGHWLLFPEYSFMRVMINTHSRECYNMHKLESSMLKSLKFSVALDMLCKMFPDLWVDAYINASSNGYLGAGAILVSDIAIDAPLDYRYTYLTNRARPLGIKEPLPAAVVRSVPCYPSHIGVPLWAAMDELNNLWRPFPYYSGMLAKQVGSHYVVSDERQRQFTSWVSYSFPGRVVSPSSFQHQQQAQQQLQLTSSQ